MNNKSRRITKRCVNSHIKDPQRKQYNIQTKITRNDDDAHDNDDGNHNNKNSSLLKCPQNTQKTTIKRTVDGHNEHT
jgi:hypothetical protein